MTGAISPIPHAHREAFWFEFCDRVGLSGVPLFHATDGIVDVVPRGPGGRLVLRRSAMMEALVLAEVSKVLRDYADGGDGYDGVIYCMFEPVGGEVHPLYIGKSEKYGKGDRNLSANIKGINAQTQHPFARWGYNYAITWGT